MKADKTKMMRLLKTARGQMDGILNMMENDRYCIDISNQLMATQAILNKINKDILKAHIECCVKDSLNTEESSEKMDELLMLLDKVMK